MHRAGGRAGGGRGRGSSVGPAALTLLVLVLVGITGFNYCMLSGACFAESKPLLRDHHRRRAEGKAHRQHGSGAASDDASAKQQHAAGASSGGGSSDRSSADESSAGGQPQPDDDAAGHDDGSANANTPNSPQADNSQQSAAGDADSPITPSDAVGTVETIPPKSGRTPAAGDENGPSADATTHDEPAGGDADTPEGLFATDPPDHGASNVTYEDALKTYDTHMQVELHGREAKKNMVTDEFWDVEDIGNHGIRLPHDIDHERTASWMACDPGNTSFSWERDQECSAYLSNLNNMRSLKPMPAHLTNGRTLKFKIYYHHGNLTAIVKISQRKFFYEAVSEYLAYQIDRALNFSRVPPTAYVPLPIDYLKAATAIVNPFFVQWFDKFIPNYDLTQQLMVVEDGRRSSMVAVQVWMNDVHSALMGYLAVNYEQDSYFLHKFYDPEDPHKWPPRPNRLTAIGDLCDRFIFDFIIGNTDRGMNDHNNFAYGGCSDRTACHVPAEPWKRTKYPAKYAFIDHGSSFYSHKEPEGNPFTGNETTKYVICRFRHQTYVTLKRFVRHSNDRAAHRRPFVDFVISRLPKGRHFFNIVRKSVIKATQDRLEKIIALADACVKKHGANKVFVL